MSEGFLESEATEIPLGENERFVETPAPLPEPTASTQMVPFIGEVKTVVLAAAGGLVAGAVTVAALKAVRSSNDRSSRRRQPVLASRSFLIDVHLLGNK